MYEVPPSGRTEKERISHAVSRMAAAFVQAAGGEIRVPIKVMANIHLIELHQREDPRTGDIVYTTRPYARRVEGSDIVEGEAIEVEARRILPGPGVDL